MSSAYIIEIDHEAAGVIVREDAGYRFYMTNQKYEKLDRMKFKSAKQAYCETIMFNVRAKLQRSGLTPLHADLFNPPSPLFA